MAKSFVSYLSDNTRQSSINLLNSRLSGTIDLTLAVKQAHWNIVDCFFCSSEIRSR